MEKIIKMLCNEDIVITQQQFDYLSTYELLTLENNLKEILRHTLLAEMKEYD